MEQQIIEFNSEFFDNCKNEWRKNKVKYPNKKITFRKTGLIYYITNSDSPLELSEFRCKTPKHPNQTKWSQCGYVDSTGKICQEQGIFYEDEMQNPEYDYEKYLEVKFCEEHQKYERKEKLKRERHLEELYQDKTQSPTSPTSPK